MNEGMNRGQNPAENKKQQEREDAEQLADYLARHPEPVIPLENLREAGPEIAEFEKMVTLFESTHSLEKLLAIVELSPDLATVLEFTRDLSRTPEELELSLRHVSQAEPVYATKQREKIAAARDIVLSAEDKEKLELIITARKDLEKIVEKLNSLKGHIKYEELKAKYKSLSRAVGMINKNKVDHDR